MAIPLDPPRPFAPLLGLERSRLLDLLGSLAASDWERPTPCPGWSVLGLATHLLGGDLSLLASQRDQHRGTPAPADLDEAGFVAWLDALQDEWVRAARRLSPRLVVDLLAWTADPVTAVVQDQDPSRPTARVSWAAEGPVAAWLDHGRELAERWIHRQQLLGALGRPSDLRADLVEPVLDTLRWAYPFRLGPLCRPAGATVEIAVTGPEVPLRWHVVSEGSGWRFGRHDPATPLAELRMTTEQAWRVLTNNFDPLVHGDIVTAGDPEVVATLRRCRAIIGTPR